MERELWISLYQLAQKYDRGSWWTLGWYRDCDIVAVFLWAVVHDRSVLWACDATNWPRDLFPRKLPSQSTMSKRLNTVEVHDLLNTMERHLVGSDASPLHLIDGKPLLVSSSSKDPDAARGIVHRHYAKGYKLHAIYGESCIPIAWQVYPLNIAETDAAALLMPEIDEGGYLIGDKQYDSNRLHDVALQCGHQLLAERKQPNAGWGHRRHSSGRLNSARLLKTSFGQALYKLRNNIERQFARLTNHAGGLAPLPNWVRRISRVRSWVQAKLLIHAVYCRYKHQHQLAVE